MPQYTCPTCNKTLRTAVDVPAGKKIVCPSCKTPFAPVSGDEPIPVAKAIPVAAAIPLAPPPPPPPPAPSPFADEDDDGAYGVRQESEEEKKLAEVNKPKFGNIADKFKKSKRGPAMALLVFPANLMLAQGALTAFFGGFLVLIGFWPLVFTDTVPSNDEVVDALSRAFTGIFLLGWGSVVMYATAKMQNLGSYSWAVAGACMAIFPLLAGVFALVALYDKRVIEGFIEPETGPIGSAKADDEDEEEDDDDEDDDDDEEERKPRKKRSK
jgi:hypothetical protein